MYYLSQCRRFRPSGCKTGILQACWSNLRIRKRRGGVEPLLPGQPLLASSTKPKNSHTTCMILDVYFGLCVVYYKLCATGLYPSSKQTSPPSLMHYHHHNHPQRHHHYHLDHLVCVCFCISRCQCASCCFLYVFFAPFPYPIPHFLLECDNKSFKLYGWRAIQNSLMVLIVSGLALNTDDGKDFPEESPFTILCLLELISIYPPHYQPLKSLGNQHI